MRWKTEDVVAFRQRDWQAFDRARVKYGPSQSERLAGSLYEHACAAIPGWPTRSDRDDDLDAHLRLSAVFERIANGKRGGRDPR